MKKRALALMLLLAMVGLTLGVRSARATTQLSERLILACNEDGTYTCGNSCMDSPYNGRWCCEM